MTLRRLAFWPAVLVALVLATVSALVSTPDVGAARSASQASPLIAFTRPDGVYVMRSDGSGVRLLRRTGSWATWVTWSPDGRKLAFVVNSENGGLWVMNADGTHAVRLAQVSSLWSRPTWSPDSRRIALLVSARGGPSVIRIVSTDGTNLRQIRSPVLPSGVGMGAVDWSPTGGQFAFAAASWGPPGGGVFVMSANGGNLRNLTPERTGGSGEPDWSPDGRRIAFTHASGGEARYEEIWVMDTNGGSRVQLTDNHVPDYDPAWSPDGNKIAFVGAYAGAGSGEIYVINADGTGFTRLTHNRVSEASPTWQPVGRPGPRVVSGVLYQKDPDGTRHVLNVYAPANGGPWPVVVMIHGAEAGFPPAFPLLNQWAAAVARQGAVVFVPRWPGYAPEPSAKAFRARLTATTGQLACAVRFARAEAKRYGGDPSDLSLFGHSAGANLASVIAFADPQVLEGCVARSGAVVPDNLVLFEGDWLIVSDPVFDDLLRQDRRVMAAITPWSYLKDASGIPVHILDSNDPALVVPVPQDVSRWLALRDPTGGFRRDLERHGALRDGLLSMQEAQRLLYRRLQSLGYPATFRVLPNSSHTHLSNAGPRILADTILKRT